MIEDSKVRSVWQCMMHRTKPNGKYQQRFPSYSGVIVCDWWKTYDNFKSWYVKQFGAGKAGYELDKDILKPGNKVYCPEFCALVPKSLNLFFSSMSISRIKYTMGTTRMSSGRFRATISVDGKSTTIGSFDTQQEASSAFVSAKEAGARLWYKRLQAREFLVDPRVMYAMRDWSFKHHCIAVGASYLPTY